MAFDPAVMREYRPDWVSRGQYEANLSRDPIRQAVLEAAQITQQNLPGQPALDFPAGRRRPSSRRRWTRNQEVAARITYTVDAALEPISAVAEQRDRETSRRWQAHYDLVRGRLLAMKIRCYEYNWACARMKKDAPKFQNPKLQRLAARPRRGDPLQRQGGGRGRREAEALLKRVIEDHPDTPWALLARRELKDPFGFKWVETYVPPQVRDDNAAAAAKKKAMPKSAAMKPAPPPKL